MRDRFLSIIRVAKSTSPFDIGWSLLGYYMVLVFATDCVIWYESGNLGGYDWKSLMIYSLMAYPLWMMTGLKGLAKEQVDLIEGSRWHAVDQFPGGATSVFLGHHLGKVLRTKAMLVWLIIFIFLATFYHGAKPLTLVLALFNLLLGSINLALVGILSKMYAPKGYSDVIGAIIGNLTWLLSGTVFPLGMLTNSPWFYRLNPFAAAVSTPLSLLQNETKNAMAVQAYSFFASLIWLALFLWLSFRAERSQRARIYG